MARERAKLSEKQERILVQAQLMGLTARDMQQIGNRLVALHKEAEDRREIQEVCEGYTWEAVAHPNPKIGGTGFLVRTPEGYHIRAFRGDKMRSSWHGYGYEYDITVTKPGTRFKARLFKDKSLHCDYSWRKKLMPGGSKDLYSLIRWAQSNKHNF
jgi:hypothetical protein